MNAVRLAIMVAAQIFVGTESNEKATIFQVNEEQAFQMDADSKKVLGYFHTGFTYKTEPRV